MYRFDESNALRFLFVSLEKSYTLLQSLRIVRYSHASVTRTANPAAECPSFVTVIEVELCKLAAALTALRFRRAPRSFDCIVLREIHFQIISGLQLPLER